jgi:hypothetical protein
MTDDSFQEERKRKLIGSAETNLLTYLHTVPLTLRIGLGCGGFECIVVMQYYYYYYYYYYFLHHYFATDVFLLQWARCRSCIVQREQRESGETITNFLKCAQCCSAI